MVVKSIADHYTRFRYIKDDTKQSVIGVLLGMWEGKNLKIYNCFETKFDLKANTINREFTQERLDAYKVMFPTLKFVGWYRTHPETIPDQNNKGDLSIHHQFQHFKETHVFLQMRTRLPKKGESLRNLPILVQSGSHDKMAELKFAIEPVETERIAIDDAKKDMTGASSQSRVAINVQTTLNAVQLLKKNVMSLIKIIRSDKAIREDKEIMKKIK